MDTFERIQDEISEGGEYHNPSQEHVYWLIDEVKRLCVGLAAYDRETHYLLGWNPSKPPEGGVQQLIEEIKRLHEELAEHEPPDVTSTDKRV
jgi:hypothetical protein